MPDVFLSYNREDQAVARRFAEAFTAAGLDVWWDTALKSGEAYDEVTETALRTAKAVVVLWSKKSVASRWVRAEATLADRNKTLVPCMIEPCERPIMFELTQTADLGHWQGALEDRTWTAFLADVRGFVSRDAPLAPGIDVAPAPPTPKSERGDRPSLAIMPFVNRSGQTEDNVFAVEVHGLVHLVEDFDRAEATQEGGQLPWSAGFGFEFHGVEVGDSVIGHGELIDSSLETGRGDKGWRQREG